MILGLYLGYSFDKFHLAFPHILSATLLYMYSHSYKKICGVKSIRNAEKKLKYYHKNFLFNGAAIFLYTIDDKKNKIKDNYSRPNIGDRNLVFKCENCPIVDKVKLYIFYRYEGVFPRQGIIIRGFFVVFSRNMLIKVIFI